MNKLLEAQTVFQGKLAKKDNEIKALRKENSELNQRLKEIEMEKIIPMKIKTTLNISDLGTKPLAGPSHHRHYEFARGVRYYPPLTSEHAKLMDLESHKPFRKPQKEQNSQD